MYIHVFEALMSVHLDCLPNSRVYRVSEGGSTIAVINLC